MERNGIELKNHDDDEVERILTEAKKLEPWWFRFEIKNKAFGGVVPRETEKVDLFLKWAELLGIRIESVLELGSHEGSHSEQIARCPNVNRVVGLEGREDNLARANLVKQAYKCGKVEFHKANVEFLDPEKWGQFDAVFCAGLLHHLPKPWELIGKLKGMCRQLLFLDTQYVQKGTSIVERYSGQWHREGTYPLSGLSTEVFWLDFKELLLLLMENGFEVRFIRDYEDYPLGRRAFVVAQRAENVGCDWRGNR